MYSANHVREELEDELYHDEDTGVSEVDSEMEFYLYSQLHYSSNAAEMEEQVDDEEKDNDSLGLANKQHGILETTGNGDRKLLLKNSSKLASSNNDSFQKNKKKKKVEKQKNKKKTDSKDQRLPSSVFEEVIVIDSSPDVISISEDESSDDDRGVCALKGQGSFSLHTSTPAQQESRNRKRGPAVPVTVLSCSSADSESKSESEFSESESSDSDGLENWMLLGQGMQAEDQSISLNLEGGSVSSTDAEGRGETWLVSEKDKEAQIYNKGSGPRINVQRVSNRYYTEKNVHCRNCSKTGHISKNCPESKKLLTCFLCGTTGHMASQCPNKHCYNCGQPGHCYESCREKAYWYKQCFRCSMKGHFIDACPEIWRQYHITTKSGPPVKQQRKNKNQAPAYCFNCSKKGHLGFLCTHKRMFSGVYPSSPFISHYDTVQDIKRRQHRIKMKVNEMRKRGHLSILPSTPHTPKPPKKKQKISHHTNNHQPNNTTFKTPNKQSHIIFTDSDFLNSTPKSKGFKQQQVVGNAKPWKPKRPVPTSRDPLSSRTQALDEEVDLPRGGGPQPNKKINSRNKKKKNNTEQVSLIQTEIHKGSKLDHLCRTAGGGMQRLASRIQKGEKKKNWKKINNKKVGTQPYHEEDNLFIIKQRKRKKK